MDKEIKQEFNKIGKEFSKTRKEFGKIRKEFGKEFNNLAMMVQKGFDYADKKSDNKFKELYKEINIIKIDIEEIKSKLDQVAYRFELESLEKRVQKIELELNLAKS